MTAKLDIPSIGPQNDGAKILRQPIGPTRLKRAGGAGASCAGPWCATPSTDTLNAMQAIVLSAPGGSDNFRLAELPVPPLRKGDVRIRVRSIGFNPVDYQVRQGQLNVSANRSPILGRDICGVVEAVHEDVADLRPGDEVYSYICNLSSSGAYAEQISVPAELVARKPTSLSHDQAAVVPVVGITAALALEKARAEASKSMFVAGGAGGVGTFVLMLARRLGVRRLIATAGSAQSRSYLIDRCGLGERQIVNYRDDDFVAQGLARNDGGFDCVLDLVGGRMLSACCQLLAVDGNLVSVTEAPSQDDFEFLFQANASFHAVGANAYSLLEDRAAWRKYRAMLDDFARMFDAGELAAPHVTNVGSFSVEAVRRAHDLLERSAVQGKLVMSCAS